MESRRGLKFLIDTNIALEVLLGQPKAAEAKDFLASGGERELFLSVMPSIPLETAFFAEKNMLFIAILFPI